MPDDPKHPIEPEKPTEQTPAKQPDTGMGASSQDRGAGSDEKVPTRAVENPVNTAPTVPAAHPPATTPPDAASAPQAPERPGDPSVRPIPAEGAAEQKIPAAATPKEPEKPVAVPSPPVAPPKPASATPRPAVLPAKPAAAGAPAAKAPPPAPKPAVKPEPWSSPLAEIIRTRFPEAIKEALIFRNQPFLVVAKESLLELCGFLKSDEGGGYTLLSDETAVDYPKREKRFEIIYQIYSFKENNRLRLKVVASEGEKVPSVVGIWPTANWLEREVYDMFGVIYEGHPDLKRILLPDGWQGFPLRKDYDILRQDEEWVKQNLGIESGQ